MLPIADIREAEKIVVKTADMLLATSNDQKGTTGSNLRRACGDLKAFAEQYISSGVIATKLSNSFVLARTTGATISEFNRVRETVLAEAAVSLTAVTIKNVCIWFSLQQMSLGIAEVTFTSREDVEKIRHVVNTAFDQAEENAADEMALVPYKTLIALHAAVTFHLYETARPLPQMLSYKFFSVMPTLIISHRLYETGARADELRNENKVVHPAFASREGKALSF
jgi:prophage DNA circulation protein